MRIHILRNKALRARYSAITCERRCENLLGRKSQAAMPVSFLPSLGQLLGAPEQRLLAEFEVWEHRPDCNDPAGVVS